MAGTASDPPVGVRYFQASDRIQGPAEHPISKPKLRDAHVKPRPCIRGGGGAREATDPEGTRDLAPRQLVVLGQAIGQAGDGCDIKLGSVLAPIFVRPAALDSLGQSGNIPLARVIFLTSCELWNWILP